MAINEFRIERDSMGEVRVPAQVYYGAQTQRAVKNFAISDISFPMKFIRALGLIIFPAAKANENLGLQFRIKPNDADSCA